MRVWCNSSLCTVLMLFLIHHQDRLFLRPSNSASKPPHPVLDVCASPQSPSAATTPSTKERDYRDLLEKTEAERDDSQPREQASLHTDYVPSSNVRRDEEGQEESTDGDKDGGLMESTGDTTVWSSLELDMNCGHSHRGENCALKAIVFNLCVSTYHYSFNTGKMLNLV